MDDPRNLPTHRRPESYEGTGKDPVFELNEDDLDPRLRLRIDPGDRTHAFIEPAVEMTISEFRDLLATTRARWRPV